MCPQCSMPFFLEKFPYQACLRFGIVFVSCYRVGVVASHDTNTCFILIPTVDFFQIMVIVLA